LQASEDQDEEFHVVVLLPFRADETGTAPGGSMFGTWFALLSLSAIW
jgi:hypothetical protein